MLRRIVSSSALLVSVLVITGCGGGGAELEGEGAEAPAATTDSAQIGGEGSLQSGSSSTTGSTEGGLALLGDPEHGRELFAHECAGCHVQTDAFDLASFGFSDEDILRRAGGHVEYNDGLDILAFVRSSSVSPREGERPIALSVANSDVDFAERLFGQDAWPEDLRWDELKEIDPMDVAVAFELPVWSDEETNLDWMPDRKLPEVIVNDLEVQEALAAHRKEGSSETASHLLDTINQTEWRSDDGPCAHSHELPDNPRSEEEATACFEFRRWGASILIQQAMSDGKTMTEALAVLRGPMFAVGWAAKEGYTNGEILEKSAKNWAIWMYPSWAIAPDVQGPNYISKAMLANDLPRHATFVLARTLAGRPNLAHITMRDLTARAHIDWLIPAFDCVMTGWEERIADGERFSGGAASYLRVGMSNLEKRLGAEVAQPLISRLEAAIEQGLD